MKNCLLPLSLIFMIFIACKFLDAPDPVEETENLVPVTVALDAETVGNASWILTVTGDGMTTIGPEEYINCKNSDLDVPEGKSRSFHVERYSESSIRIDTGTAVIDIGPETDTVLVTLAAAIAPPEITTQPDDQSVMEGETVSFSVAATGDDLHYQWRMGTEDIEDATSATFTISTALLPDDGAVFRCVVSNMAGEITSDPATLTVNRKIAMPRVTVNPVDRSVTEGESATFSISATGDDLHYQWQKGTENISEATASAYTTPSLTQSDDGATYRCIVGNQAGSDTSGAATLTVTSDTVTHTAGDTICPVITILDGDTVQVQVGDPDNRIDYYMKRIRVTDNSSAPVTISDPVSNVNVFQVNSVPYRIIYTARDTAGNTATATRYVFIVQTDPPDKTPPVVTIGEPVMYVNLGDQFVDPGATAFDNVDGVITQMIVKTGTVDTDVLGTYTLTYRVADNAGNSAAVTRTVIVREKTGPDYVVPVIRLMGPDTINVPGSMKISEFMELYTEPGYTATDDVDGDITDKVKVSSLFQLTANIYYLTYDVNDAAGNNAATKRRLFITTGGTVTAPIIDLNYPDSIIQLVLPDAGPAKWREPGYTASDAIDGDLTKEVILDSSDLVAHLSVPGTYVVIYSVTNSRGLSAQKVRIVQIVTTVYDLTPPVITLLGRNPDTILVKSATSYVDPGAVAVDDIDGDVTARMIKSGTVNMNSMGKYSIMYVVTDNATNRATAVRTVWVVMDTAVNDLLVRYGVPSATPLPSMMNKVYVSWNIDGQGPDLTNVTKMQFAWDAVNKSLYNFSLQFSVAPYLMTLTSTKQTFAKASPAMTIAGSGIPGLDGDYYVSTLGTEFYWVEQSGRFAIIWSE